MHPDGEQDPDALLSMGHFDTIHIFKRVKITLVYGLIYVWAFPGQVPKKLLIVVPLGKFEGWGSGVRRIIFHGILFSLCFFVVVVFNRTHLFITSLMKNNRKQTNNILRRTKDFIAPAVLSALPSHVLTV